MQDNVDQKPVVLITGSAGLIGGQLTERLRSNYTIVGMDVAPAEEAAGTDSYIQCDLTSDKSVADALNQVRNEHGSRIASVIHLAAWYDFSGEPSDMYQKLTVAGTSRLLKKLQEFETEQFVFSSSMLVLEPAESQDEKLTESSSLAEEPWAYPKSKIEAEEVIERDRGGIPTVILRIAGVYDEGGHSLPIAQQIDRIYNKKFDSFFFPGDASHGQPFIHLDDLSACVETVINKRHELGNQTFLIAEPEVASYDEMQESLGLLIHGKEWPSIRVPKAAAKAGAWVENKLSGDEEKFIKPWMIDLADDHYPIAIDHARNTLGWEPRHKLKATLPAIIQGLKDNPKRWYEENGLKVPSELEENE